MVSNSYTPHLLTCYSLYNMVYKYTIKIFTEIIDAQTCTNFAIRHNYHYIVTLDSNKGLSYLVLVFVYKHCTVMPITRYLNINLICIILLKFSTVNNVLDEYGSSIYCTTS